MITRRLPGFNAYPMLRDGDVIVSVGGNGRPISDTRELQGALIGKEPGSTIELLVQRAGQLIRVPIRLSRRPVFRDRAGQLMDDSVDFKIEREQESQKYWDENFAKLLEQRTM
jgi:C-terminal processing protease CtpA/Prc